MGVTRFRFASAVAATAFAASFAWTASAAQTPARSVKDKVYSTEQATRGEDVYTKTCATCHDPAKVAEGRKPAPQLVGDKFLGKWKDKSLGELMTLIATTMPDDGSIVLTDDQTADIVGYLLKANGFPDGPAPLKISDKDIVIVVK
jgi:mono/diheme cytochrome c family protein